jgi:hypothetical protein
MIAFHALKTKRITAHFQELSIAQDMEIAGLNPDLNEALTSRLLGYAIKTTTLPLERWTVQERMLGVAHYLSHTLEFGGDFDIGAGKLSDYVQTARDCTDPIALEGYTDKWAQPITAKTAEAIELHANSRADWFFLTMAASIRDTKDLSGEQDASDAELSEGLLERLNTLRAMPSSEFSELLVAHTQACEQGLQFFNITVDKTGFVVLPFNAFSHSNEQGAGSELLHPTRFSAYGCISEMAQDLCG